MRWRPARMRRHARGVSPTCWPSTYTAANGTAFTLRHPEPAPAAVGSGAVVLPRSPAPGAVATVGAAATAGTRLTGAEGRAAGTGADGAGATGTDGATTAG